MKTTSRFPIGRPLGALAALGLAALLHGCGGGSGGAAPPPALAANPSVAGTVTGFGSVFVDGVELQDATARIARENADGSLVNDVLQLGQRVRLIHDGLGHASQVLVEAAVIGSVSSIDLAAKTLLVAAQKVVVNSDSAAGPLTVFGGGYTDLSSVTAGDLVEVHGTPVFDAGSNSYKVQATRIQKASGVARVLVNGKISGYATTATGARFNLNGLGIVTTADTRVRPSGATLADGTQVTVFGGSISAGVLSAANVRVNRDQNSGSTASLAQLSGLVSGYNASAGTFELQGTTVHVGSASVLPSGATLANGVYARIMGSVNADGSIAAVSILVRTADVASDLARIVLIGAISDFVDAGSFVVRGVPVDATGATLLNCSAALANGTPVLVQASQQAGTAVVKATRIACGPTPSEPLMRPVDGTVASVNAIASTFVLTTTTQGTQEVQWNDTTTFVGVTADTLAGKSVRVEGYLNGTRFVARVVRADDALSSLLDDLRFRLLPALGNALPAGWLKYRARS